MLAVALLAALLTALALHVSGVATRYCHVARLLAAAPAAGSSGGAASSSAPSGGKKSGKAPKVVDEELDALLAELDAPKQAAQPAAGGGKKKKKGKGAAKGARCCLPAALLRRLRASCAGWAWSGAGVLCGACVCAEEEEDLDALLAAIDGPKAAAPAPAPAAEAAKAELAAPAPAAAAPAAAEGDDDDDGACEGRGACTCSWVHSSSGLCGCSQAMRRVTLLAWRSSSSSCLVQVRAAARTWRLWRRRARSSRRRRRRSSRRSKRKRRRRPPPRCALSTLSPLCWVPTTPAVACHLIGQAQSSAGRGSERARAWWRGGVALARCLQAGEEEGAAPAAAKGGKPAKESAMARKIREELERRQRAEEEVRKAEEARREAELAEIRRLEEEEARKAEERRLKKEREKAK